WAPDFSPSAPCAGVKSRYASPFRKIDSAICRCRLSLSDCLYSSSQPRPSQRSPSKMEFTDASVLRSTSVSSSRKTMVPPFRRAYNQLKIKVRALPTCKNPVGDGANRTRSITREYNKLTVTSLSAASQAGQALPSLLRNHHGGYLRSGNRVPPTI